MKALLLFPEFPASFWNYKEVCRLAGAKHPAAPLGLITLAALLPQDWDMQLVDLNTSELEDEKIDWADLVFISGMMPQQANFLKLIDRAHAHGKKVVAGGPDPTSQPEIYKRADFLVLGEAENNLETFLHDVRQGVPSGVYPPNPDKPDITQSPIPRYDLLNLDDYLLIGLQTSRGCPFNCEFCDIIELYGRRVRTKTPDQVVAELHCIFELGYRGQVDFVDDNFIGNKGKTKEILEAVRDWSKPRRHPFYFSTEASINLADDDELLKLFKEVNLRHVFVGIETTDNQLLKDTQKSQNTNRPLVENIKKIQQNGIMVIGGFIVGFDNETSQSTRAITEFIRRSNICMAMVGLLFAMPNTQLTRRLTRENRLHKDTFNFETDLTVADQTTSGLNFDPKRPRKEILEDFLYIQNTIYDPKNYFDRCLNLGKSLKMRNEHRVTLKEHKQRAPAFFRILGRLGFRSGTAYLFWRTFLLTLFFRPFSLEEVFNMMTMYIHLEKHKEMVNRDVGRLLAQDTTR